MTAELDEKLTFLRLFHNFTNIVMGTLQKEDGFPSINAFVS